MYFDLIWKNDTELGKQAQVYGCWRLSPRRINYKMLIDEVNKRH
jgi:hypothetical protein